MKLLFELNQSLICLMFVLCAAQEHPPRSATQSFVIVRSEPLGSSEQSGPSNSTLCREPVRANLSKPLQGLPFRSCPEDSKLFEKLPFQVRFVIDQFIAAGDLEWRDLTAKDIKQLSEVDNTFDRAFKHLTKLAIGKTKDGKLKILEIQNTEFHGNYPF